MFEEIGVHRSHSGNIYVRKYRMLHAVSKEESSLRLVTLSLPGLNEVNMDGAVLTTAERKTPDGTSYYLPGMSPIFLRRLPPPGAAKDIARVIHSRSDEDYAMVKRELDRIEKHSAVAFHEKNRVTKRVR